MLTESRVAPSCQDWTTVFALMSSPTYANMWHMEAILLTREFSSSSDLISILGSSLVQLLGCCQNSFVHKKSETHTTLCNMFMMWSFLWIIINNNINQYPASDLRRLQTDATKQETQCLGQPGACQHSLLNWYVCAEITH